MEQTNLLYTWMSILLMFAFIVLIVICTVLLVRMLVLSKRSDHQKTIRAARITGAFAVAELVVVIVQFVLFRHEAGEFVLQGLTAVACLFLCSKTRERCEKLLKKETK